MRDRDGVDESEPREFEVVDDELVASRDSGQFTSVDVSARNCE
ncbi:hypothetical protein [Halorubellus litoreus]|uniref:Uncharacterized protein n=1 Tax=Halorubellus litoreus TaxID=755308 RepID=A0ABD5VJN6_9EURY